VASSSALPKERLPIGTLSSSSQSVLATHSHISIIPRQRSNELETEGATDSSETPVHLKPSYITETDLGRDRHLRSSKPATTDKQPTTFADMARAGLGAQFRPDHMASHEPISLHNYVKFKRPKHRKGAYSPMIDDMSTQAGAETSLTAAQPVAQGTTGK
jgi:hypothetical protein